jgi:hypothetical protein
MIYIRYQDKNYEAPDSARQHKMVRMPDNQLALISPLNVMQGGHNHEIWVIYAFIPEVPEAKPYHPKDG